MPLTPEEEADVKIALKPLGYIRKFAIFYIVGLFVLPLAGHLFMPIFVAAILVWLPWSAYNFYCINKQRIAEGKTSLSLSRRVIANHHHRFNQATNFLLMVFGIIMMIAPFVVPFLSHP